MKIMTKDKTVKYSYSENFWVYDMSALFVNKQLIQISHYNIMGTHVVIVLAMFMSTVE